MVNNIVLQYVLSWVQAMQMLVDTFARSKTRISVTHEKDLCPIKNNKMNLSTIRKIGELFDKIVITYISYKKQREELKQLV